MFLHCIERETMTALNEVYSQIRDKNPVTFCRTETHQQPFTLALKKNYQIHISKHQTDQINQTQNANSPRSRKRSILFAK